MFSQNVKAVKAFVTYFAIINDPRSCISVSWQCDNSFLARYFVEKLVQEGHVADPAEYLFLCHPIIFLWVPKFSHVIFSFRINEGIAEIGV